MPAPAPASIPPATGLGARERLALVAVLMAVALATLDSTIVNTALPGIAADLQARPAQAIWVVNAYQLAVLAEAVSQAMARCWVSIR